MCCHRQRALCAAAQAEPEGGGAETAEEVSSAVAAAAPPVGEAPAAEVQGEAEAEWADELGSDASAAAGACPVADAELFGNGVAVAVGALG